MRLVEFAFGLQHRNRLQVEEIMICSAEHSEYITNVLWQYIEFQCPEDPVKNP